MRILFLTNLLPYPLDNGGKIKSYTTVKSLKEGGHIVDIISFKETKNVVSQYESEMLKVCNSVHQIYLRLTTVENKYYMMRKLIASLLSPLSFGIYKYRSKAMKKLIINLSRKYTYDCIYFDHLPMCTYLKLTMRLWPNAKYILDEHNCEALIMKRNAENTRNILKKVVLKLETKKLSVFECKSIRKVNRTIVLSAEDYNVLKGMLKAEFVHSIIPIGVQDKGIKKQNKNVQLNILFIGTLTWEPNNRGLIWFLNEVVPRLEKRRINYYLYIVGKNPSDEVKKLSTRYNNIKVTGYVESVDEYYDKCDCTVVPLFIGSGQRVKLIEAFSKGMPAISTTIGAEGLFYKKGEDLLIADTAEDFCEGIERMLDSHVCKSISKNARKIYENYYSPIAISKLLLEAINQ